MADESEQFRKIFIGGLHYETTDESLRQFYEKWGEVVDCVVMRDPYTRKSRGFGFITYSSADMVDACLQERPHVIDGKSVDPKRAMSREDSNRPEIHLAVKKLFVGGVKDGIEEGDLQMYFQEFGNVTSVEIVTERETGRKRGFAFVSFDDCDAVDKIVLRKNHVINGNHIEVKKAMERDQMGSMGGRGGSGGGRGAAGPGRGAGGRGRGAVGGRGAGRGGRGGGFGDRSGGYGGDGYGAGAGGYGADGYGSGAGGYGAGGYGAGGYGGGGYGGDGYGSGAGAGGYGASSGGWGQGSAGGYGNGYGSGGGAAFGSGYGSGYGGGAMKSTGGYSQRGAGPYGGGYGSGAGGYGGAASGYGGGAGAGGYGSGY